MKKLRLGKTGLEVSRVGMGGIPLTRTPEMEIIPLIHRALDLGINFIDTAFGYSTSEERIGKGIVGRRDEVYIATKTPARDAKTAEQHLGSSLKRLNVDHIDLWQFHGVMSGQEWDRILAPDGAMTAMKGSLREGKISHIGASSHNLEAAKLIVESGEVETMMFPFNCLSMEYEELVALAEEHDVGFLAMKPFAGGVLTDARIALGYLLDFPNVVPVPGMETIEKVEQVVDLSERPPRLTDEDKFFIRTLKEKFGSRYCRQCEYCMPCPQGVFIPGILYLKRLYELWPSERYFDWSYVKKSVESASHCVKCGECEPKCLFHLPIRDMIDESVVFHNKVAEEWSRRKEV